ncbi:hypothetical protein ACLVWU_08515 [Bdellovibrio sp. HCB290]|uniref:hypothetical protein n=1 Tax=Bdellovibrio sp. HCB290 TaxID=3394356 RepID=UPI0039B46195
MKTKILILFLIALAALAAFSLREFFAVDACLDGGGCYDYTAKVCRMHEPDAQELCDKSMGR